MGTDVGRRSAQTENLESERKDSGHDRDNLANTRTLKGGAMADGYDRFENEGAAGSSFVMELLTGTVLGAGLGMLFAPKAGSDLRNQISEQAGSIANTASEGYRRAAETAGEWAEKSREVGREVYDRAREAVSRGSDEAQRYVREATGNTTSQPSSTPAGVAAAYVVITSPPLRRPTSMAARRWLGASIPVYLMTEVRRAWAAGGGANPGASLESRTA